MRCRMLLLTDIDRAEEFTEVVDAVHEEQIENQEDRKDLLDVEVGGSWWMGSCHDCDDVIWRG